MVDKLMELAIQKIAAICFLIIGLSHIFQPRVWAEFFILFRSKGEAGSFLTALLHLPIGALIVVLWESLQNSAKYCGH